jgi:hypothetical protein
MLNDTAGGYEGLNRSLDMVRSNPLPFALIGIGAVWLIASNTGYAARIARDERIEAVRNRATDLAGGVASDIGRRAGDLVSDVAGRAERALGQTGNAIVDTANRIRSEGWVHQATDMAQDALRSARDSGGALLSRAGLYSGDGANGIINQVSETFERHPLAVGAIGMMAGAALALLLPPTRTEDAMLGDAADGLWRKAQEAGQQAVERVRDVGARAAARATDAAEGMKR